MVTDLRKSNGPVTALDGLVGQFAAVDDNLAAWENPALIEETNRRHDARSACSTGDCRPESSA
jgi:hypothetical protein